MKEHLSIEYQKVKRLIYEFVFAEGWEKGYISFLNEARIDGYEDVASVIGKKLVSAWKFFVGTLEGGRILVIENEIDRNCLGTAELGGLVTEIASEYETAFCLRAMAGASGIKIRTCVSDRSDFLPFLDSSFDLIAVFGLEQVGRRFGYEHSNWLSIGRLVVELKRLLTPGGTLFIGSNGVSAKIVRKKRMIGIPSWLIRRIISRSGMKIEKTLYYFPFNGSVTMKEEILGRRLGGLRAAFNVFSKSEGIGYVCRRQSSMSADNSIFDLITRRLKEGANLQSPTFERLVSGSAGGYVMDFRECIVRLPATSMPISVSRWRNNYNTLLSLKDAELPFRVPKPILFDETYRQPFSVESKLQGISADERRKRGREDPEKSKQAVEVLIALYRTTGKTFRITSENFDRIIGNPINLLKPHLTQDATDCLKKIRQRFSDLFLGQDVQLVRTHGDFKTSNIMAGEEGQINSVFDWDLSVEYGLPLLDLLLFIGFAEAVKRNESVQNVILEDFIRKDATDHQSIRKYLSAIGGIDDDKVKCLALLCIFYYFVFHMGFFWRELEVNRKAIKRVLFAANESGFFGKAGSFSTAILAAHGN